MDAAFAVDDLFLLLVLFDDHGFFGNCTGMNGTMGGKGAEYALDAVDAASPRVDPSVPVKRSSTSRGNLPLLPALFSRRCW
jgi:hypothetical protein